MKQAIALIMVATALFLPAVALAVSDHIEYNVGIAKDGSAFWTVIHVTDMDAPVGSWDEFEQKTVDLIETSELVTGRDMGLDWESLEMSTEMHWETSSKKITYRFLWLNFCMVETGRISFGDVFTGTFFSFLQGDGELYVKYPGEYSLSLLSSSPDQRDESSQTLHWYRTQDFLKDGSVLLVTGDTGSVGSLNIFGVGLLGSGGLIVAAIGLFVLRSRAKRKKEMLASSAGGPSWREVDSDQEKILSLIKASGGKLKQSEVCTQLRFSRAKTSMLLAEMEKNSLIKRDKRGKNKIVFPVENKEGRKL